MNKRRKGRKATKGKNRNQEASRQTSPKVAGLAQRPSDGLRFAVGSLRYTNDRSGRADLRGELGLVKAALLYADHVELCSYGSAVMSALDDLTNLPTRQRLELMREFAPEMKPAATAEQLAVFNEIIDNMIRRPPGSKGWRRLPPQQRQQFQSMDETWEKMRALVEGHFREAGAESFRAAQDSGLLTLRPFSRVTPMDLLRAGVGESLEPYADKVHEEYQEAVLASVRDAGTYPLFDDLTGDLVGEAVRRGTLRPTPGAAARGRHAGLSGDLLQRLPLFERAGVDEILDIRGELAEYLDAFRLAVSEFSEAVAPAAWEKPEFEEEAGRVYREKVATAVRGIETAVKEHRQLKNLSNSYGPPAAGAAATSFGAFVGSGSALAALLVLAAGLPAAAYRGAVARATERHQVEGDRLYFYYYAGRALRPKRR